MFYNVFIPAARGRFSVLLGSDGVEIMRALVWTSCLTLGFTLCACERESRLPNAVRSRVRVDLDDEVLGILASKISPTPKQISVPSRLQTTFREVWTGQYSTPSGTWNCAVFVIDRFKGSNCTAVVYIAPDPEGKTILPHAALSGPVAGFVFDNLQPLDANWFEASRSRD